MPTKKLITAEDLYDLQFVEDPQISADGQHIAFVKLSLDKLGNQYRRHIWLTALNGAKPKPRQFTFGAKSDMSPRWSPDGKPQIVTAQAALANSPGNPQMSQSATDFPQNACENPLRVICGRMRRRG